MGQDNPYSKIMDLRPTPFLLQIIATFLLLLLLLYHGFFGNGGGSGSHPHRDILKRFVVLE